MGDFDHQFKVVMAGDSSVGKTSLLVRFTDDTFNDVTTSTNKIDCKSKIITVDGLKIKFNIYDTAGQEKYRTLTNTYFREAAGVLMVYSITDLDTFKDVSANWQALVNMFAPAKAKLILLGNKLDLEDEKRKVSEDEARDFAESQKWLFSETSAKTNRNVDKAFQKLAREILKRDDLKKNTTSRVDFDDPETSSGSCC